jgi:hypothetical protein
MVRSRMAATSRKSIRSWTQTRVRLQHGATRPEKAMGGGSLGRGVTHLQCWRRRVGSRSRSVSFSSAPRLSRWSGLSTDASSACQKRPACPRCESGPQRRPIGATASDRCTLPGLAAGPMVRGSGGGGVGRGVWGCGAWGVGHVHRGRTHQAGGLLDGHHHLVEVAQPAAQQVAPGVARRTIVAEVPGHKQDRKQTRTPRAGEATPKVGDACRTFNPRPGRRRRRSGSGSSRWKLGEACRTLHPTLGYDVDSDDRLLYS